MTQQIKIHPYNPDWPQIFDAEAALIKNALGARCEAVHHVGSTAVPGLSAKPKIDIIALIPQPNEAIEALEGVDYAYRGEYNIPDHFGFSKRGSIDCNLHVYAPGHPEIALNLMFRDYLRKHPEVRDAYGALKLQLISNERSHLKAGKRFTGYNLGKNDFITQVLKDAHFDGLCMRQATHTAEWSAADTLSGKPNREGEPGVHLVFYQGAEIVGYTHFVDCARTCSVFKTEAESLRAHFEKWSLGWVLRMGAKA